MGRFLIFRVGAAAGCLLTVALGAPLAALALGPPEPVSPASGAGEALVEARCPTFSFAGLEGARGYELVVLAVPEGAEGTAEEPPVVATATLSPGARAWTPSLGSCLERGGRYAWSVRAVGSSAEGPWSEPALFRVAAGPSAQEVEAAIETLRRYREEMAEAAAGRGEVARHGGRPLPSDRDPAAVKRPASLPAEGLEIPDAVHLLPRIDPRADSPELVLADAPVLGSPSLSVSANIALGAASNLFKDGAVFLWDDTSGNTALGRLALASATGNATGNTAFGREALRYTDAGPYSYGSYNTAVGDQALRSNTTGSFNTASGYRALFSNTGSFNTASGFSALRSNTTGSSNTASGDRALDANTTGIRNTASGSRALRSNTTGFRNTASGTGALFSNTTGSRNTASGDRALESNTTGSGNTASGYRALRANSTAYGNTASGYQALDANTTGIRNTASGSSALVANTTGFDNTASGYGALFSNTTGARNTAVGRFTGTNATTGDDNIFLGSGAFGTAGEGNTIRIGGATGTGIGQQNRTFVAGIHGTTVSGSSVNVTSSGQLGVASSSERFKEAVEDLGELGERVAALRPVTFRYRSEVLPDGGRQVGLLAEEVAELFPELVALDVEGRPFSVRYDLLSVLLLNELQRTERELEAVRDRLTAVEQDRPPGRSSVPWWRRPGGGGRDAP